MFAPLPILVAVACALALPLSLLAILRRRADGWIYASLAAAGPIFAFVVGGGIVLRVAASFRWGLLHTLKGPFDVSLVASELGEYYAEVEPAARFALWLGGAALLAVALAVGVVARQTRGARRRVAWLSLGVASISLLVTWRAAHLSERALSDVVDERIEVALASGTDGCNLLESLFDASHRARVSLDGEYPRAREKARACLDERIAHLDDGDAKAQARAKAAIARAAGSPDFPATPAAQLLATCALPMDPAQRAELERRVAAER